VAIRESATCVMFSGDLFECSSSFVLTFWVVDAIKESLSFECLSCILCSRKVMLTESEFQNNFLPLSRSFLIVAVY
jgi:hypothetical protein